MFHYQLWLSPLQESESMEGMRVSKIDPDTGEFNLSYYSENLKSF